MTTACIIAARRSAVAPRGGALGAVEPWELGAATIRAALADADIDGHRIDLAVYGNALYAGGNPARLATLAAGLPERVAALTIDSQCCAGMDAIALAAAQVEAGHAEIVLAGGLESYTRAPLRMRRATGDETGPVPFDRPPFTPWPERDPDMLEAAANLAAERKIDRRAQEDYAIASHARTRAARSHLANEIVPVAGVHADTFARRLDRRLCGRLPVVAGDPVHGLSAATVAVEADAAASVIVMSETLARQQGLGRRALRVLATTSLGGDPAQPALVPIDATRRLLAELKIRADDIAVAEVMEAFAVQAMACIDGIGLDPAIVNPGGGALARGHPIGASGAILAVRLWQEMQTLPTGSLGIATIAAAGGLGSALVLKR
ncbi:thiolase family protein [Minwuia thermotolerans]|uniref:Acetyl-CoA C-acyltransferase n=1 Tax=Minwuia thermotolerans TaxID=2056226 RepID=A0A2M9G5U5_9PROT|nr:thiolase family protein [Minwuia thermotolerans]PJK31088.1 acetyl-CoA C-acyltransferase [Minwuia thermotolerans]